MLNIFFYLSRVKYFVYFTKDVEDWCGYGNLNVVFVI